MAATDDACIRCDEALAVDELGYCGHCHWAVRAEIEEGFYALRVYLERQAMFSDYLANRGAADMPSGASGPRSARSALRKVRGHAGILSVRTPVRLIHVLVPLLTIVTRALPH